MTTTKPLEPRAERATSQDGGGDADGGPDRSTSGSVPALPPVHMKRLLLAFPMTFREDSCAWRAWWR